jgi:dsRNA-specific ribonuclease
MEQKSSSNDSVSIDTLSSSTGVTRSDTNIKRKHFYHDSSSANKRSKLNDMIFYDGNCHPAAVLHDLRREVSTDKYHFESEEIAPRQTRFRCTVTIDQNVSEPITAIGVGRSKQLAKNMAAQVKY